MLERSLFNRHSKVECSQKDEGIQDLLTLDLNHVVEEGGELTFVGKDVRTGQRHALNFRTVIRVDGQPLESLYQQLKRRR
jgi:hypothetical protein